MYVAIRPAMCNPRYRKAQILDIPADRIESTQTLVRLTAAIVRGGRVFN